MRDLERRAGSDRDRPLRAQSARPISGSCCVIAGCSKQLRPAAYLGYTIKPNIYGSLAAGRSAFRRCPNVSGLGTAFMRRGPLQPIVSAALSRWISAGPGRLLSERRGPRACSLSAASFDATGAGPSRLRRGPRAISRQRHCLTVRRSSCSSAGCFETKASLSSSKLRDRSARELSRRSIPAARGRRRRQPHRDFASANSTLGSRKTSSSISAQPTTCGRSSPAATAIVLPSYREGLPRSLLEAAAMARPLIAADVPGCRDVVEDGVNGYLCTVRDAGVARRSDAATCCNCRRAQQLAMGGAGRAQGSGAV